MLMLTLLLCLWTCDVWVMCARDNGHCSRTHPLALPLLFFQPPLRSFNLLPFNFMNYWCVFSLCVCVMCVCMLRQLGRGPYLYLIEGTTIHTIDIYIYINCYLRLIYAVAQLRISSIYTPHTAYCVCMCVSVEGRALFHLHCTIVHFN